MNQISEETEKAIKDLIEVYSEAIRNYQNTIKNIDEFGKLKDRLDKNIYNQIEIYELKIKLLEQDLLTIKNHNESIKREIST